MSRRSQDIPIRPRYGYMDEPVVDDDAKTDETGRPIPSNNGTERVMASSYKEIPFLAQYACVEKHTSDFKNSGSVSSGGGGGDGNLSANDDDDEDDDDEAEDDSKEDSSCEANKTPKRPNSLQCGDSSVPYELEGSVRHEGQMLHFVADNLEHTLKTASPVGKKDLYPAVSYASRNSTPSTSTGLLPRQFLQVQLPQIDANVLNDIEIEAQYLAASVDNLTENLCNLLHSISSITADNVEVHKNAVNKLTDSMDANIKCMYTIMAKTEEITKSMKPTEQLGQRIREIKRLVDMLESNM